MDKFLVYLAGAMETATDGRSWRSKAANLIEAGGLCAWDPYVEENKLGLDCSKIIKEFNRETHFHTFKDTFKKIVFLDLGIIEKEACAVLVRYDQYVKTGAGTHAEISFATYLHKPVYVWLDGLTLTDVPVWSLGCFDFIFLTLEQAVERIVYDFTR